MKVNSNMAILFWLYTQKMDEFGKAPIYCRITLDGKRTQFSTAKKIEAEFWISDANKIDKKSPDASSINEDLESIKGDLRRIYNQLTATHKAVTGEMIKNTFTGKGQEKKTLMDVFNINVALCKEAVKKEKIALKTLQRSAELLQPNKIYRDASLKRRCLVLSSGFYEWRHIYPIGKRTGKPLKTAVTYPYFISLPDKEYFYMAGIWQPWTDAETGEYVESDAIITTTAVEHDLMSQVHNTKKRMPTILNDDLAYEWLFGKLDEKRILEIAKTQYPSKEMHAYPIAKD